ncbi:MAG: acetate--CoA ligase family protein [Gemmataceae bacterium]
MSATVLSSVPASRVRPVSHPLDVLLAPRSVAVFGACETPGSLGRALMYNLVRNPFGGVLFPVCPQQSSLLGVRAYPRLTEVPGPVELAIVASPAAAVPDVLAECGEAGVKAAIVLSPGFGECGPVAGELEGRIRDRLRGGAMRVLGVSSFGVACPRSGFNATCAPVMVPPGNVGLLSQGSALITAVLDPHQTDRVGCTAAISVGSLLDISWTEWLKYLAEEPNTDCIGIYMERLDDPRAFFAAAREVAAAKPIILVKGGGDGDDPLRAEVFDEACRCNGVLRVQRLPDLFRMAAHLTTQRRPRGRRLTILTNTQGPEVLAADALRAEGGRLAPLAPETVAALGEVATARWNRKNPIDAGEDADAARFLRAAELALRDPNTDALLVLLTPQAPIDPVRVAEGLRTLARAGGKPVLACWMWGAESAECDRVLRDGGIPSFSVPEAAIRSFNYLCQHAENLRFLAEIRQAIDDAEEEAIDAERAGRVLAADRPAGDATLAAAEASELLSAYGLPVLPHHSAGDAGEAVHAAEAVGYPVTLELVADEGELVRLKADDAAGVRRAVGTLELVAHERFGRGGPVQVRVEPVVPSAPGEVAVTAVVGDMGPVIRLGEPSPVADAPWHATSALAPLTPLTAREMIEHCPLLAAARAGRSVEYDGLERVLLRLSRLITEQRRVRAVAVDAVLVAPARVLVRDARVTLND